MSRHRSMILGRFGNRGTFGLVCRATMLTPFLVFFLTAAGHSGTPFEQAVRPASPAACPESRTIPEPRCGIELTCTDKPIYLGFSDGACFRATCPGIWAVIHKRGDQASFRRRFFTYRHYNFAGRWELKDQGMLETGPVALRELFLVLPDDLIEFRLSEADCNARIEIKNLGYIKKGTVHELQEWLAYSSFMEQPSLERIRQQSPSAQRPGTASACPTAAVECATGGLFSGIFSLGRGLGLPLPR